MGTRLDRLVKMDSWQINAIGLVACAALGALWYAAGFTPLSEARAAREAQQRGLDVKREDAAHLVRMEQAHQLSLERIKADANKGAVTLEPVEQLLTRIGVFSRAAAEAGLTLDEIKPGAPIARERFTVLPIHLSGTGTFPGCAGFLHGLRSRFPDTGVIGLELHGEPEQSEKPARFVLELAWYAAGPAAATKPSVQTEPAARK